MASGQTRDSCKKQKKIKRKNREKILTCSGASCPPRPSPFVGEPSPANSLIRAA